MAAYPKIETNHLNSTLIASTDFSSLYLFTNTKEKEEIPFILKCAKTDISRQYLINEFQILRYLSFQLNRSIIRPIGIVEYNQQIALKLPYINAPTLKKYIQTNKFLSEEDIKLIFLKIVTTVNFLHNLNITHRDLKPENILYNPTTKEIILIDFGLAKQLEDEGEGEEGAQRRQKNHRICGSLHYMAPELIQKQPHLSLKCVDIWMLGVLLYEMTFKRKPFESTKADKAEVYKKITDSKLIFKELMRKNQLGEISLDLKKLLNSLLEKNPKKRISYFEIIEHPWFKKK